MEENKTEKVTDNAEAKTEVVSNQTEVNQELPPESKEDKKAEQSSEQKKEESNPKLDKLIRRVQYIALIILIIFLVWYFVISPMITFKQSEKIVEEAGKSYFELNHTQLPTGERIATVTLQDLFTKAFIKEDIYIPNTKEPCSLKDSWVKVKRVNGEYQYYTYLKCGLLQSSIDHEGPEIVLNGDSEITISLGDEYKEQGVKSVTDNKDGDIPIENVVIKDSALNVNEIGEYEITYTAVDSLNNKTTVTRTVNVISTLKSTVNNSTDNTGYYTGKDPNNYIYFSGILFRIIGTDGDNIKIIAAEDISNVDYAGIDDWLDYFYEHLTDGAKKLIVENKYCNMSLDESTYNTTECTSYTKKKKAYIISIDDINKASSPEGNYLKLLTLTWTANKKDSESAYLVSRIQTNAQQLYEPSDVKINCGIRPVITISGDNKIKSGTGTYDNPYRLGETPAAKVDDKINTRSSGEYIEYSGLLWRIIEVNDDGTTKVISNDTIKADSTPLKTHYTTTSESKTYNPKQSGNIGYYINNKISQYIDTSYFVNREIEVPIYETDILYNKETETKKYKVKLSAPNMYEMFSAYALNSTSMRSYWLINSSKQQYTKSAVTDIGVAVTYIGDYTDYGIRIVANLNKSVMITKGKGTLDNPYNITK